MRLRVRLGKIRGVEGCRGGEKDVLDVD